MYRYDEFDAAYVRDRVTRFRAQIERRLEGVLTEEEFKPLRLQNGLYLQLHAYMLRVAIPYGTLNGEQMRQLAMISEKFDRGYGHFTTRQNIQYNWPTLDNIADILDALAEVGMHAIQTSGNCIRNVTADHFAGAAADEVEDPRATAELLRQWSTDHPEFAHLPRKFKIAITGSPNDRAVTKAHDIGLRITHSENGEAIYEVMVGGGLGRTPHIAEVLHPALPASKLLEYIEAIMRVYNLHGRRDNKYKARIKILLRAMGVDAFSDAVETEFKQICARKEEAAPLVTDTERARIADYFQPPAFIEKSIDTATLDKHKADDAEFARWCIHNLDQHRHEDYDIVTISLKPYGKAPGDASAEQMRVVAELAEQYGHDEIRVSHEQNLVLPHIHRADLHRVYTRLREHGLATSNVGLISDIIACPGMDYCSLATARSIPIAQEISEHFSDSERASDIGDIKIKISGCINACAHHHVGNIGILGLEKGGTEYYQFTFGGDHRETMKLGKRAGPGIEGGQVVPALERVVNLYLDKRRDKEETFLDTCNRLGPDVYNDALYDKKSEAQTV